MVTKKMYPSITHMIGVSLVITKNTIIIGRSEDDQLQLFTISARIILCISLFH